jgi:hypothetical protein
MGDDDPVGVRVRSGRCSISRWDRPVCPMRDRSSCYQGAPLQYCTGRQRRRALCRTGQRDGVSPSYLMRLVRLSYLAPDITQAIFDGRQPRDWTADKLLAHPIWECLHFPIQFRTAGCSAARTAASQVRANSEADAGGTRMACQCTRDRFLLKSGTSPHLRANGTAGTPAVGLKHPRSRSGCARKRPNPTRLVRAIFMAPLRRGALIRIASLCN